MGAFSVWHWLIVLLVVVLLFGTKKLRNLGGDLGAAVRGFKKGMNEDGAEKRALEEENTADKAAESSEDTRAKT